MTLLERIAGLWFGILDASARAAADLTARVSTRRRVRAVEGPGGELLIYPEGRSLGTPLARIALQAGAGAPAALARLLRRSHVTVELDPARFVFQTMDLPGRATEFIAAIVRTQIDRLTPWTAEQVVFGWTAPAPKGSEGGVVVTVAATDKDFVAPLVRRVQALGAAVVLAEVPVPEGTPFAPGARVQRIEVARETAAAFAVGFWRRQLGLATALVVALVIGSSLYDQIATLQLTADADDLAGQQATKRALVARGAMETDPATVARRIVEQRKATAPSVTLTLEAASRALPDQTFLTSFELTGTRLRLVGFTSDAPALIKLIDASGSLTGAAFFAPTTRMPDDPGDRFNIEASVQPDAAAP